MKSKGVWAYVDNEVGHIYIEGIIGQEFHKEVRAQLESPEVKNAKSLVVHIQSPGGSVYAGYNTYHVLKSSGKPITSIIEGEAQSMATFISLAGDKIIIRDPSTYMIHNPSQGFEGDADAFQGAMDELRTIEDTMSNAYAAKTKIPVEQVKQMMKKTTRLTAQEAMRMGFVDEVSNVLKAVAIGKHMETTETKKKTKFNKLLTAIASALGEESTVKAIDLQVASGAATGKTLHVEGETVEVGMTATLDGAPAEGVFPLQDGRSVTVAAGKVTAVTPAPAQPEKPAVPNPEEAMKAAQLQIAELTAKLNQQASQTAAATEEKAKLTTALATVKTEIEEMKKETVGDDERPSEGMVPSRVPVGFGRSGPNAVAMDAARTFLIEHMPSIEQYYPMGFFNNYKKGGPNAVSILETNFNYVYPGILTTDLFYKPTMQAPALSDFGMIDQDIKFRKNYNLVTELNKIVQPYTGCGGTPAGNRQLITNTEVRTKEFQVYEGWCKDDFTQQLTGIYNFLAQEWLKTGLRQFDPAGTPIDTVIMNVLKDGMQRDIFRRFHFAAGNSSDSDYNQFDGLWDRLIDSSGAQSNYCVVRAGSSIAGAITSANALTYLGQAYTAAKPILKNNPKARFFVTRTVWDAYYDALIGNGAVTEQAFKNLQDGIAGNPAEPPRALKYKGYPVIPVDLWDQFLTETDNPLYSGGTQRNLILFTIPENHIYGVENGADLNKIESWYENKDQKRYYRSSFKLGYNYLHCDLQVIMY